jgi:hypothetical protein
MHATPLASRSTIAAAAASSRASAPRRSEPQGNAIVNSSAIQRSSDGMRSAEATTNSAFGTQPRAGPRAARREASAMAAAFASTPMTSVPGSERARSTTARPSPVPRSTTTRQARAIRCCS